MCEMNTIAVRNWRHLVEMMSSTNRISASKYDFPWCFPSEEILKIHFRILTFPSICSAFLPIEFYARIVFLGNLELFNVEFAKWWSWSTIGLIGEVCLSDSVELNYSHCRNDSLLFDVNYHNIEIRLLWEIGGIWLKWCRERIELVLAGDDFRHCFLPYFFLLLLWLFILFSD
jgi:hypothetical protein